MKYAVIIQFGDYYLASLVEAVYLFLFIGFSNRKKLVMEF